MRASLYLPVLVSRAIALPSSYPDNFHTWHPQGPGDVRAPCPMLNSLANHGFLPHSGKNITAEITQDALFSALNVNKTVGKFLFDFAITTAPQANATTFDLDNLARHNILEHDASLSREDAHFGNPQPFSPTVFAETTSYFKSIIDVQQAADARLARVITSNTTNPDYSLSDLGQSFSLGESAAYILALGNGTEGKVKRELVEYLFEKERLPVELGWERPKKLIQGDDLSTLTERIINATGVAPEKRKVLMRASAMHGGIDLSKL
ncbi:Chloroperoxidase [Lophiotrema nucula]|uniref:Chloroperoxidase n=1 Tax=Lophiotrema nucula TaxID=690887 RepID=A0A6A5YHC6_9PLEO|nr:Chloroperoxidase [Lophiotrema nucula]